MTAVPLPTIRPPRPELVRCALCARRVPRLHAWQVPARSGEWYCRRHWSTDDARLQREGEL